MAKTENGTTPAPAPAPSRPTDPSVTPHPTPEPEPAQPEPQEPAVEETVDELKTKESELEGQLEEVRQKLREKQTDTASMPVGTVVTIQLGMGTSRIYTKQGENNWTGVRVGGDGSIRVETLTDRDVTRDSTEQGRRPQVVRPTTET